MHNAAIAAVLGIGVIVTGAAAYKAYTDSAEEARINELIKYAELGADPNAEYSGYSVEELGEGYEKPKKTPLKTEIEDFPVISQYPELPTGCEITSACALLRYLGFDADKTVLCDLYMRQSSSFFTDENDVLYGPDPDYSFAGDPYDFGYGCYENVICSAMNSYFAANRKFSEYEAVSLTGINTADLEKLIDEGVPVIVWASQKMDVYKYSEQSEWYVTGTDKKITWLGNSHTLVLVGYDLNAYYFMDCSEDAAIVPYSKESFSQRFAENGSRACAVKIRK
ncbi:MAG: C39 family peptidase [Oscillospiraceae bacterium]